MVVNAKKTYFSLLVIVLLSQLYLPSFRYNIILQFLVLCFVLYMGKSTISKRTFNIITPIILIVLLAGVGTLFNHYRLTNIVKDISHIIKPVLGVSVGYFLVKEVNDFKAFVRVIVITGVCCAVYHLTRLALFAGSAQSVSELRDNGLDNFLELFALVLLMFSKKIFGDNIFAKKTHYIVLFVLALSCFLYFSRTMIVVFVVLMLSVLGYSRLTSKSIKVIGIIVGLVLVFYAYLFSIKIDRSGSGVETFFYKVKNAPLEVFQTKIDVKNHADLWDHWRGYEAKRAFSEMNETPQSYIYGTGYGSLVNLRFFAPLGDSDRGMKYISELHNGYAYIIYKTGLLGLGLMLMFLYRVYLFTYETAKNAAHGFLLRIVSSFGLLFFFTSLTITGIYNQFDVNIILLGAFLFFESSIKIRSIND